MKVDNGAVGVLVCPRHKSGDVQRTAVSQEVLDAAVKLRQRGHFARDRFEKVIAATCRTVKRPDGKVGIPVFTPGRFRHSVATWAIEAGAAPESVAAFLGHKSMATTRRFYAVHATVPKVPTLA
jgi:integrase